ncbi:hypothetical protein [Salinibaculum salinum]|uniref:hypothetical protein n=1 Tax=Salinibaculum salinum TaxID=3131996 RepID=UPI0030EE1B13
MTGDEASPLDDSRDTAPVDFDRLDRIRERLGNDDRFVDVTADPDYAPSRLVLDYDEGLYPPTVAEARLEIVWYENNDFSIHYHERQQEGTFDHRWDRHPSTHNDREHVHPGPDAPTPGSDTEFPADWRDVLATVLREIEERQRAFWS